MAGPWEDYAPTKATKVSGPWEDYGPKDDSSLLNKIVDTAKTATDPLRQGASSILDGLAATRRQVSGDGIVAQTLASGAKMAAPSDYTPAAPSLSNIGDVPKAVAESVPGMAMDIPAMLAGARILAPVGAAVGSVVPVVGTGVGAAAGGLIGGVGGLAASIWSRSYGNRTADAALGRTGDRSVEPNSEDKGRALAAIATEAALSRIGLKSGIGVAATAGAGGAGKQVALQAAKAAGVNAGTEVATEAVDQALVDRKFDQQRLEGAALTGAATGGAMRGVAGVSDINAARKFGDVTPQEAAPLVKRLQALHPGETPSTPEASFKVMNKARQDLDIEAKARASDARDILTRLKELDPEDDTAIILEKVRKDIAEKRIPNPRDFEDLSNSIGKFAEGRKLIDTLQEQTVANKVITMKGANWNESDGTFAGGASGSDFAQNWINPTGHKGAYLGVGSGMLAAIGYTPPGLHFLHGVGGPHPAAALAVPAAQAGIYGTLKLGDKLTGNANPLKLFQQRYSDAEAAPGVDLPRFSEIMANARMAERARTPQEAPVAPQAPTVAPTPPQAASEAPSGPSVDPATPMDPAFNVVTPSGTRQQLEAATKSRTAYTRGVQNNEIARRDILTSAIETTGLSPTGTNVLSQNFEAITRRIFNTPDPKSARGILEEYLDAMPDADAAKVRKHLKDYVDPVSNKTFWETWRG